MRIKTMPIMHKATGLMTTKPVLEADYTHGRIPVFILGDRLKKGIAFTA